MSTKYTPMQAKGFDGMYILKFDATGTVAKPGDTIKDSRGELTILESGQAPHKPDSQGFVTISKDRHSHSASVYGLRWVKD